MKFSLFLILPLALLTPVTAQDGSVNGFVSDDPEDIHFFLYSNINARSKCEEIVYDDPISLINSKFNPELKTALIIHGFRSNLTSEMPQMVKNAFLYADLGYNLIVVSWGALATPAFQSGTMTLVYYQRVTLNVPIVAERVTQFLLFLLDERAIRLKELYLIGHSLGAHVAGLTGRNIYQAVGEKVARITGLDPAGPLYWPPNEEKNLMKENAEFVDVIHTNMYMNGDFSRDGHADFYPNGGLTQPNCLVKDVQTSVEKVGRCSHWYAYKLFAASIRKKIWACPCSTSIATVTSPFQFLRTKLKRNTVEITLPFLMGQCRHYCKFPVRMGYWLSPLARGEFYLTTY